MTALIDTLSSELVLRVSEREAMQLTHAIPTVTRLEIYSVFDDCPHEGESITLPAFPWPNVRTLRWDGQYDLAARRFSMETFPNVTCLELDNLNKVTIDSFASARSLQQLELTGTYIRIDAPCRLPQLRSLTCNYESGVCDDWLQLDSLTSLDIREPLTTAHSFPNITTITCYAVMLSEWIPRLPRLQQLTVILHPEEYVSLPRMPRLTTCTLHIYDFEGVSYKRRRCIARLAIPDAMDYGMSNRRVVYLSKTLCVG